MIKNIIAPIQAWFLSQGRCAGCGTSLLDSKKKTVKGKEVVTCKCKRIYIIEGKSFRRAKFNEV